MNIPDVFKDSSAPLGFVRRKDLVVSPAGADGWNVKDPLTLRYYRFQHQEWFLLDLLDGKTSLREIVRGFERRFCPERLGAGQFAGFLEMLLREGLVSCPTQPNLDVLLERRRESKRAARLGMLTNLLAIRFRGLDPDRWLTRLHVFVRPLLSAPAALVCVLLVLTAVLLLCLQPERFWNHAAQHAVLLQPDQLVLLAVAIAFVKTLHELGHALACKHFGGECHEMGVMLLAFTPCLYCNVSDAWMLPRKWHRVAVSAAGIAVELVLFALCTCLWWFSQPGPLHSLCFNLMLVCSVSTLVLNANPLLRYDGYFILSDLAEIPNLRQQADAALRQRIREWFLGLDQQGGTDYGNPAWLLPYACASFVYRWIVVGAILWLIHAMLVPYRLQSLVLIPATLVLGGLLIGPVRRLGGAWREWPGWSPECRRRVIGRSMLLVAASGFLFVPLPTWVTVPARLEAEHSRPVYVSVPGVMEHPPKVGSRVEAGELLAQLKNLKLERDIAVLRGQRNRQRLRLKNLEIQILQGVAGSETQVAAAKERLDDVERRLQQRVQELHRLELKAPVSGMVFPTRRPRQAWHSEELSGWEHAPTDPENAGCLLSTGTILCYIGDPVRREAILEIDETDIELIRQGHTAVLQFRQALGAELSGAIVELEEADSSRGRRMPLSARPGQSAASNETDPGDRVIYRGRVPIPDAPPGLATGTPGFARIRVRPQSLAWRSWRWVSRTFGIEHPFASAADVDLQ